MAKEFTGDADPRRSIELLWGAAERGRRGPKPRFSVDDLVDAAIAVADAEGLAAVSMRRVAEAIGVSPMSLYTYVQSKAELTNLMFDRVLGEMQDPDPAEGWRACLSFVACQRWTLTERHPWVLDLAVHRPPLGPNLLARVEAMLVALDGTGLSDIEKDMVIDVLHNYIAGALHEAREAREAEQRTGLTDEQWFSIAEPALQARLDPDRFPAVKRLGAAWWEARHELSDPVRRFKQGLEVVLDGVAVFIASRRTAP